MDRVDYQALYALQDRVLAVVFDVENEFYLTGGTCLSRFCHEKRYSDDLEFFTNNSARFGFAVKNIKAALLEHFAVHVEVDAKDFVRYMIDGTLQVDFVNDHVPRYRSPRFLENGYIIDTVENILSNKITAVMGRDNPKDVFDIYLIAQFYPIDWKEILESAHDKAVFSDDELIARLKAFPPSLFQKITLIDETFLDRFDEEFSEIIDRIIE